MKENESKKLSLQGAAGDVAISCDKALSSRGRAESSDVVISCVKALSLRGAKGDVAISCDKVLIDKKNPEKTKTVIPDLIGHLSRIFNLIRRFPEFFAFAQVAPAKNRDGSSFYFGFAKVTALAFIFTLIATAESRAEDVIPTSGTCNADGTCLWALNSAGTLSITAKDGEEDVKMDNYYCHSNPCNQSSLIARPWENNLQQIKSIVIGDNITHIGDDAFQNATNLTSVTGMKDVKTIGDEGVFAYTVLREITIPDGVTYIGLDAFNYTKKLKSVTLPDTISDIGSTNPFVRNQAEINCLNTHGQCENLRELLGYTLNGKTFNIISPTSNCETYNNKGCTSCEKEYTLADGMCWAAWEKKHYTPAEANQWLKDDNNTIIMTFKVNR